MKRFEDVRVYELNIWPFNKRRTAVTLPGIGILVGPGMSENTNLLMHEYGHILQRKKFGWFFFWFRVAPISLWSCIKQQSVKDFYHQDTWTEWSANRLSLAYFGNPENWDRWRFPTRPIRRNRAQVDFPSHSNKA